MWSQKSSLPLSFPIGTLPPTMRVGEHDKARTAPSDCGGPETTYAGGDASGAAVSLSVSDASNDRMESGLQGMRTAAPSKRPARRSARASLAFLSG